MCLYIVKFGEETHKSSLGLVIFLVLIILTVGLD